jgi:hypothetical protein
MTRYPAMLIGLRRHQRDLQSFNAISVRSGSHAPTISEVIYARTLTKSLSSVPSAGRLTLASTTAHATKAFIPTKRNLSEADLRVSRDRHGSVVGDSHALMRAFERHLKSEADMSCFRPLLDEEHPYRVRKAANKLDSTPQGYFPAALLAQYPELGRGHRDSVAAEDDTQIDGVDESDRGGDLDTWSWKGWKEYET